LDVLEVLLADERRVGRTLAAAGRAASGIRCRGDRPGDDRVRSTAPLVSEQYFKNIQLLRGCRSTRSSMRWVCSPRSMGNDCTYCHAKEAGFRREAFAETTPRIQRARQ